MASFLESAGIGVVSAAGNGFELELELEVEVEAGVEVALAEELDSPAEELTTGGEETLFVRGFGRTDGAELDKEASGNAGEGFTAAEVDLFSARLGAGLGCLEARDPEGSVAAEDDEEGTEDEEDEEGTVRSSVRSPEDLDGWKRISGFLVVRARFCISFAEGIEMFKPLMSFFLFPFGVQVRW